MSTQRSENSSAEPGIIGMLIKDSAIVFAALSLWAAADTWYEVTGLAIAQVVAVGDAILVGLLLAALAHEWGHYAGARAAGAVAPRVSPKSFSLFRFNFDFAQNDQRQFHWMTYGGHVFHWSMLLVLAASIPLNSISRIALVSAVFGFILFATLIEYGIVKDTWRGADPQSRLAQLNGRDFQHAYVVGSIGGIFALATTTAALA